jgi:BON domain
MTDDELQDWVRDELFWDPKVDSAAIAVSASDGEVTLRGTPGSLRQKREAQKAAERVYGVTSVHNNLEVRILDEHGRQHADLLGAVLQAMAGGVLLPVRPLLCVPSGRLADSQSVEEVTVATTRRLVDVIGQGAPLPASDVDQATTRALALLRPAV